MVGNEGAGENYGAKTRARARPTARPREGEGRVCEGKKGKKEKKDGEKKGLPHKQKPRHAEPGKWGEIGKYEFNARRIYPISKIKKQTCCGMDTIIRIR